MSARILLSLVALLLAVTTPAVAQTSDMERRTDLARRLVQVSQGANLMKQTEAAVLAGMGDMEEVPERERAWLRENAPRMATRFMEQLMEDLIPIYAETFTREELEAQIAFYETSVGRSIASKSIDLGVRQSEAMVEAQQVFMLDLFKKYCAAFNCEGQATAKP